MHAVCCEEDKDERVLELFNEPQLLDYLEKSPGVSIEGWAIPMATDIAFAVGIMAMLGKRVSLSLKVFLTALAIVDDIGAVVVIATCYTTEILVGPLITAGVMIGLSFTANRLGIRTPLVYAILGVIMWLALLKSGVHATLAGVAVAFFIPLRTKTEEGHSPLEHLEHILHPWVAFAILPIFAFANAGRDVIAELPDRLAGF